MSADLARTVAPADLVLLDTDVYTGHPARHWAQALAVRGGRIVAVGPTPRVREHVGPRTQVLDLPGRMVMPGFQDAHVHPPMAGMQLLRVSLHDLHDLPSYLDAVARYARDHPGQEWVTGGGWAMDVFPGGTPRARDLDAVVPDRPVYLTNRDGHGAWVNTRALELAGITAGTPDPADGRIERHNDGSPTGTLHEGAAYALEERLVPAPGPADWEAATLLAQARLHALGITGWQDAWVTPPTLRTYRRLADDGRLTARVVAALWWERGRGLEQIDDFVHQRAWSAGGSRLHPTTVKIMADGVLENYTGSVLQPYCDGHGGSTGNHGIDFVDRETLARAVTRLDALGFQVHVHAIGDRAVRGALDAFEAALMANGHSDGRHHIAHLQMVDPADIVRFRRLGVAANLQAYWAQREPQLEELTRPYLGDERTDRMYPFGDLRRAGATLAMGSDWFVTTADPLRQIEVAVRRADPGDRDAEPFLAGQALTLPEALAAITAGSAFVNHDDEAGMLAAGRRADLAVLDRNLFDCPDATVADARVERTIVGGRTVFERG